MNVSFFGLPGENVNTPNGLFKIEDKYLLNPEPFIEFLDIPNKFTHLLLKLSIRSSAADVGDALLTRFNKDSGNNYTSMVYQLYHSNSLSTSEGISSSSIRSFFFPGNTATTGLYSNCDVSILEYSSPLKAKQLVVNTNRILSNTSGNLRFVQGFGWWLDTALSPINSILFYPETGPNFMQYSRITLFGMK